MKNFWIIVAVVIALLIGGTWWSNSVQKNAAEEIDGLQHYSRVDRSHVGGVVDYELVPPVGGPHAGVWAACNGIVYEEPVQNEQAVHSLEHGAVWITYQPSLSSADIDVLKSKVKNYMFMSPLPEQTSPIILTAWGKQLVVDTSQDPRIDQFIRAFRQGSQTPEPGATCNSTAGGMQR